MIKAALIEDALMLSSGARFYRCALQVNPFTYVNRYNKPTIFNDEKEYNEALINECKKNNVEVIAITDHQRCDSGIALAAAARAEGIKVFPGAELETKEGIHVLLLFDVEESIERIKGVLGACGIYDSNEPPNTIKYDIHDLLEEAQKWDAVCIAAHIVSDKGILKAIGNQARVNAWKSPLLSACALLGPIADIPDNLRPIIENKNAEYKRERPPAIINAQDVSGPDDLQKPGATCWIKMSEVTIEGLRQAFLDPESRIRLVSDPMPEEHTELIAIAWEGGFLDGTAIHFNENLNVLIGGRGTGKSTVIESLRYVLGLEPLGDDSRKTHEGIVKNVLRSGTKITLFVRAWHPIEHHYIIERTIPNPPVVKDEKGDILTLTPVDIVGQVEVYGQHEISELAKSAEKRTKLLERFIERDTNLVKRKADVQRQLERSRSRLLEAYDDLKQIDEKLSALPATEETLRRFQEAGLEDKLKEQSLLVKEERVIKTAAERLEPFKEKLTQLEREVPIDRTFISPKALQELPGKDILSRANSVLEKLSVDMEGIVSNMKKSLELAQSGLEEVQVHWNERKQTVMNTYEKILRELQKSAVDGEEFIRLRRQVEELRPLREKQETLKRDLKEFENERKKFLNEWEDLKAEEFRRLERAAKKVSRKLEKRVWVEVKAAGDRERLIQLLRDRVGGRLSETTEILKQRTSLSITEFTAACREGKEVLARKFEIPTSQADRIVEAGLATVMEIEELELPPITTVKLNIAAEGQPDQWQTLEDLSTGQKATAILLLLLLESQTPLIIDQPEDDLDNRFITEGIVPKMREEKRHRQFVFATHNANIPVLGDAELIIGLSAYGEANQGKAKIPQEHMGSIDSPKVCILVGEVLEGGKEAFEMRRLKYGF
jgi:predicted ATPase